MTTSCSSKTANQESGYHHQKETEADVGAFEEVTIVAFKTLEISNNTEHFIIKILRAASDDAASSLARPGYARRSYYGPGLRYCVLQRNGVRIASQFVSI